MSATSSTVSLAARVRQLRPSATLGVSARVRELRAAGHPVIGFGAGEPDFETPAHIADAAVDALRAGQTHYAPVAGTPEARLAIAAKLRRDNGIDAVPEGVVISNGAKQSLYLAFQCVLDPGDEVLLPTPAWVSYRPMIELAGGVPVEVPGSIDNDFRITPEQLEAAITSRTKALLVNSPSNPCGTMYAPEDLEALAAVVADRPEIVIVTDEIYEKLVFGDVEHRSLGSLPSIADRVVTINGLSKAYAMTGWRIGYAHAPLPLARAMSTLQSQMTSGICTFNLPAVVEALERGEEDAARMRDVFAERARMSHERLSAIEGMRCPKPMGAFYLFPDVSALYGRTTPEGRTIDSSVAFAEALLEEAAVAVVPGPDFGEAAVDHVRLSCALGEAEITEGFDRIAAFVASLR